MGDDETGSKRRPIAYLSSFYPRATDTFVRNEVFLFRERGHEVHTFSARRVEASQLVSDLLKRERAATTYLVSWDLLKTPMAALRILFRSPGRFFRALALAFRTRSPGLKAFAWQMAYFLEGVLLADRMRAKAVRHLHNHIGEGSASVAMLASELSGVPFSLTIHGSYIFRAPIRWALGEKITRSAFTACISDFTRSQCMIYTPLLHWQKLHVVRCGPDPAILDSEPTEPPSDPRLVWVGRLCEEKSIPILIRVARRLAEERIDFRLVLVGDGPLRAAVEAEIDEAGLREQISITGWMDGEGVRDEIVASRALVLPSFAEGLPVVIMEAFALGRPVLSTYVGGIPELVEPGVNGWLIPASSEDRLLAAMREILEAPVDVIREMGRAGREAVLQRHDPRVEVAKLEKLMNLGGR